jgi:hypothetical protein
MYQNSPLARDDECIDPPTARLLVKKTWCHGQIIAVGQGVGYAYWGIAGGEAGRLDPAASVFLVFFALLLPLWTVLSWRATNVVGPALGRAARKRLLGAGALLCCGYVAVLCLAAKDAGERINMFILIFTGLQLVETAAFLVVVSCLGWALEADATRREDQLTLI